METAYALVEPPAAIGRNGTGAPVQPPSRPGDQIVACSVAMRAVLDLVGKVATTDTPVLIQGELGVGKAMVAREIQRQSRRAAGPFVHVACGTLREAELNEKLFGEVADGLTRDKAGPAGLLQSGGHGTLFLDDVARLPLWAQVKLLDYFQQNKHRRRGAVLGARLISATTAHQNEFYAGLYYYLNVVQICIPPLRHRPEDIRRLCEHFLAAVEATRGAPAPGAPRRFSDEAWHSLLGYDWPGNALQLAGVVTRAMILADGPEIGPVHVAESLGREPSPASAEMISLPLAGGLKEMELAVINEVLRRCRGNKAAAARSLGLHRRTLYRLLGR
jgi:DNA-binding NtrC family response regulator